MLFFSIFGYSNSGQYYSPIPKLVQITPYSNAYANTSSKCEYSQTLYSNFSMTFLCTKTFSEYQNSNATPYSIALLYYAFTSPANATSYINGIIEFQNTTPWPNNIATLGRIQNYKGVKIYETTTIIIDPTNYTHVNSIYAQIGDKIIAVSSLSASNSRFVYPEEFDSQMLYNWYTIINKTTIQSSFPITQQ